MDNFRYGLRHLTFEKAQHFWRDPPPDYEATLGVPDIIHVNNFFCPTARTSARVVYTLYDLSFLDNPEWTTERNRVACFSGAFNSSLCADRNRRHLGLWPLVLAGGREWLTDDFQEQVGAHLAKLKARKL